MSLPGKQQKDLLTQCLETAKRDILSVGSGDGSQQVAIVKEGLRRLQVTFFDSREAVLRKYPHCKDNLEYLERECTVPPRFQVDAKQLDKLFPPHSFDLIIFTFPHTGVPNSSVNNVSSNQTLLRGFLQAAGRILRPHGEIQVTLKRGEHYEKWKLPSLADEVAGLQFQSTHEFEPRMFPGYKHRLTKGMKGPLKVVPDKEGAKVHVFKCPENQEEKDETNSYYGKILSFLVPSEHFLVPSEHTWSDQEVWAEVVSVLSASRSDPRNVLEIRRNLDPTPDTRQLNRVLYAMEGKRVAKRHSSSPSTKSKKPRWSIV